MTRIEKIRKFGLDIVENDEETWKIRGYIINYKTGLLEKITPCTNS